MSLETSRKKNSFHGLFLEAKSADVTLSTSEPAQAGNIYGKEGVKS